MTFVSFTAGCKKLTKDSNSVYTTLKLLSAPPKSQLISEFFQMSAKQQKCCAVQQTLLMDFLQTHKKKSDDISQRCRSPCSSHVLSAFLVEHERSAAYQDGRFKFSMRSSRGLRSTLLYCTFKRLPESIRVHPWFV